jgi:cytochrome P450
MSSAVLDRPAALRPPAPIPHGKPLGILALIRALRRNPLETWTAEHFEKPIVVSGLALAPVVVVSEPGAIRRVLLDNSGNYQKDALTLRILSAGLTNGLLTAEGEQWRVQRRTLAPMFSRRTVINFAPAMADAASALIARWRRRPDGATVDVAAEATRVTLDVLARTIFSDGLGSDPEEFRGAMASYFDTIGKIDPFDVLNLPDFVPRLTRLRARATLRFFDNAVDTIVATRRRNLAADPAGVPRDILTLLLEAQDPETGRGMSEIEVRANIITFIAAGHETTSNTLAWSIFLLSQAPQWRERVVAEARRELGGPIEGLAERLVQTRAVIEEAMRLYPPIVAMSRAASGPDELAGHPIARGTMVVVAPYVLHRHRGLWEAPDVFDPGRFLGAARDRIDRYAYLPFGAGPRICIGNMFALQEATLVLAMIMSNFHLELPPGHEVWPLQRVTLRPADGLPMIVSRRK